MRTTSNKCMCELDISSQLAIGCYEYYCAGKTYIYASVLEWKLSFYHMHPGSGTGDK